MNSRNPVLLVAIAFVVLAGGFYKFVLSPKTAEVSKLNGKIGEAQDRLDAARTLLASNEQARATFRSAYSTVVRLGKAVPVDDDVRSLLVQLDRAAKATFVDFQSIVAEEGAVSASPVDTAAGQLPPGATVGPAGFPVMPFSFTFRGRFFRLSTFFQRLDELVDDKQSELGVRGRLLTVDGVKLEPDTTGFPNIKATVQATSYLVSPLEGATGGASPAGPAGATAPESTDAAAPPTTTASIR